MRTFKIKYNDGVFAGNITFNDSHTNDFIENYLQKEIKEFNNNLNENYHITRKKYNRSN